METENVWYVTKDGHYLRDGAIRRILEMIFWKGYIDDVVESGYLTKIDPPSIIDLLKQHDFKEAVARYRVLNPNASIKEAFETVKTIRSDISRNSRRRKQNG